MFTQAKLLLEEIEMLLNALVYDGKVEWTLSTKGENMYRAIQPLLSPPGLIKAPCGICPVRRMFIIQMIISITSKLLKIHFVFFFHFR